MNKFDAFGEDRELLGRDEDCPPAPSVAVPEGEAKPTRFEDFDDAGLGFEVERFNGEDGIEVLIRDTDSAEWTSGLALAKTSPETVVTMLADAYEALGRKEKCNVPPQGWWCSRKKGHEGPCAARRAGLSSQ